MKIILFLLFIHNLMAQPGPIQTQEAGISNYQIQATTPATTPIAGKQYLYNANDVLSTKDSLNNVQRVNKNYDNYVPNFDLEQGLTPYLFTAGRAVINSVTPLEGLKSLDFDGTALNDFIETPLITIPRVLMGNTCMIKVAIRGSDANLQLQLINGAGTIIAFKQLAVYPDTSNQFLAFSCPTQALITATPALGQLKIKINQSTATNAALATLDSFYLGRFESNTMTVQSSPQWYYFKSATDINGDFSFPPPTASTNDKTLFNYTGTTLTAIKSAQFTFNIGMGLTTGAGSYTYITPTCIISGISRSLSNAQRINHNASYGNNALESYSVILNTGDTCVINMLRGIATAAEHIVNITATPLPQLATIVNTNTPRAGLWASRTWAATAGCSWLRGTAAFGPFPAVAACGTTPPTNQGFSINDATLNGQLPQITLSKYPKGFHYITLNTELYANGSGNAAFRISDGINVSSIGHQASTGGVGIPSISFIIYNPTDRTNVILSVEANAVTIGAQILSDNTGRIFTMTDMYMPDLSDPYSIPELYAALPPQVINSSGKIWRSESCLVNNPAGTATLASSNCTNWIQSVNRTAAGRVTINIIPNIFSTIQCTTTPFEPTGNDRTTIVSNAGTNLTQFIESKSTTAGTNLDVSNNINCQGLSN